MVFFSKLRVISNLLLTWFCIFFTVCYFWRFISQV